MSNLLIQQYEIGPMQNFIYFIGDRSTNEVAIIDPAWDVQEIFNLANENGFKIKALLITHGHFDHTNGVEEILKTLDVPVYLNKHEADFFKFNWSGENLKKVDSGDKLKIGNIEINFLHTPGHTPGSQCFLIKDCLVSGDTLFINGCGRCDLPGGDVGQMFDTIANKLMKLSDDTILFPGHNYAHIKQDTLKSQKNTNPYMQYDNLKAFIGKRMPKDGR